MLNDENGSRNLAIYMAPTKVYRTDSLVADARLCAMSAVKIGVVGFKPSELNVSCVAIF